LKLTVTAEEVETAAQAKLLADLSCDTAQGWHYGAPGSADSIVALLTDQPR
jgi:EAL domain-containing protein (putative c-di-GMP-specific phosphodiesterase class I)